MKTQNNPLERANKLVQEELDRPDSIWLSLSTDKIELHEHKIMSMRDAVMQKGDFGNIKGLVISEIPLYGDDPLEVLTEYIFKSDRNFQAEKGK